MHGNVKSLSGIDREHVSQFMQYDHNYLYGASSPMRRSHNSSGQDMPRVLCIHKLIAVLTGIRQWSLPSAIYL
jgi:hypothetical protein